MGAFFSQGAFGQVPPPRPEGEVFGRITATDGRPLPHAWLRVETTNGVRHELADSAGRYEARVPAGETAIVIHVIGHRSASVDVVVPAGARVQVDVSLEAEPLALPGIVVRAAPFEVPLSVDAFEPVSPSTASDVAMAALTLDAGLANVASAALGRAGDDPSDGSQVLLMRGSTADLKLLLLDGAPVYTPFHLGGMLESFDPSVLGAAAHFVGAAPSRYDGGIDYILDLRTRRPTPTRNGAQGTFDLVSAHASAEFADDSRGLLLSGRRLHDLGSQLLHGVDSPYGYADGLLRGSWDLGSTRWAWTGFANRESVALGLPDVVEVPEQAEWGNRALSTRVEHTAGGFDVSWVAAASRYDARLPLPPDSGVALSDPVLAEGRTSRLRATVDFAKPQASGGLRFGASFDRTVAAYGSSVRSTAGDTRTDARAVGNTAGIHAETTHTLAPSLTGRIGGRIDHFQPGGTRGALRGSLAWSITPDALLTAAAGRYHQFTRASDQAVEGVLAPAPGSDLTSASPPLLGVATGDHVVIGLDQSLTASVRLGLQAYVKRFEGVLGGGATRNSSGIDLRLRGGGSRQSAWLGYALNWSWQDSPQTGSSERFVGRHLMSAGYRGVLAGPLRIEARLAFSDGLPLTEIPLDVDSELASPEPPLEPGIAEAPALTGTADDFFRVDLEIFGEWNAPMGSGRVRPYLRIINALDRRDALFYYFEPWRDPEITPLARQSFLPIVGLAWSF